MKTNTKIMAASLSLMTSLNAVAGIGGLNVQSNLGEPFSGSIVVTGTEANALIKSGSVHVSGANLRGTVVPQGNDRALIRLHSAKAVHEPILSFTVQAGKQTRQYTAMVNPANYKMQTNHQQNTTNNVVARSNRATNGLSTPSKTQSVSSEVQHDTEVDQEQTARKSRSKPVTPPTRAARYHRVESGESLASIAARYRPNNMSLSRAMRALVAANPRAFRNGNPNLMYQNVTLYVPTVAQFHTYANKARKTVSRRHANTSGVASATAGQVAMAQVNEPEMPIDNHAVNSGGLDTSEEVSNIPQSTSAVPEKSTEEAAMASNGDSTEASIPTQEPAPVETMASSAMMGASSAAVQIASDVEQASDTMPGEADVGASVVATVETPLPTSPTKPTDVSEGEGDTDWTTIGLGGALAVAAIGGGLYALSRRRKEVEEGEEEDSVLLEEQVVSTASDAAQRLNWDNTAQEEVQENIKVTEEVKPLDTQSEAQFNLSDFEPDSLVAEDTVHVNDTKLDWTESELAQKEETEWLEEDVSWADLSVPEEATQNQYDSSFDNWLNEGGTVTEAETQLVNEPLDEVLNVKVNLDHSTHTIASSEEKLADALSFELPAVEETVTVDTDIVPDSNVIEPDTVSDALSFELPAVEETVTVDTDVVPDSNVVEPDTASDALSFELPAVEETVTVDTDVVPDSNVVEPDTASDALSFELPAVEETVTVDTDVVPDSNVIEPDTANDALSFELPAVEETITTDADVLTEVEPKVFNLDELDFDLSENVAADALAVTPKLDDEVVSLAEVDTASNSPEPESDTVSSEPTKVANEDEMLDWGNFDLPETTRHVDFVSEAVGVTAPLEAKLDLAKMYLEIDDAVAAREILRELVSDSTGDVQARAKALLDELDV